MKNFTLFAIFAVIISTIAAYDIIQDDNGDEYYLVPITATHERHRRGVGGIDVSKTGPGFRVTGTAQGTLYNNGVHQLDGSASASKNFRPNSPTTVGGGLNYQHLPSGSNLNLGAQRTPKYGTDFSAQGTANIWRHGNSRLDAVGQYNRHYGGLGGTGRPNYYGGLQFNHRF